MTKASDGHAAELANFIASQIMAEQNLSNTRMTWNLTFQGFAIAAYALISTADTSQPAQIFIQTLMSLSAIVIAGATLTGLLASEAQRDRLKAFWLESGILDGRFPPPFSTAGGSKMGRWGPRIICIMLMIMWVVWFIVGTIVPNV